MKNPSDSSPSVGRRKFIAKLGAGAGLLAAHRQAGGQDVKLIPRRTMSSNSSAMADNHSIAEISPNTDNLARARNYFWSFEEFIPAPENEPWIIIDNHDTGHVLRSRWERNTGVRSRRINFDSAPDGRVAFCHKVRRRDIVRPLGIDSPPIPMDFSTFSKVVLRYHHWIEEHSYFPGKWMSLQLGRGYVGRGHAKDADRVYGRDGCSSTTMHPARVTRGGNGIRLMASHTRQRSPYGELFGRGKEVLPRGTWLTTDVIIDKNHGYKLYLDGVQVAASHKVRPMRDWNSCRSIWTRVRLMHGGDPEDLRAINDYRQWFGGFFIAVV